MEKQTDHLESLHKPDKPIKQMKMEFLFDEEGNVIYDQFSYRLQGAKDYFHFKSGTGSISEDATYEDLETVLKCVFDSIRPLLEHRRYLQLEEQTAQQIEIEQLRKQVKRLKAGN